MKTNILGYTREQLREFLVSIDEKPFRADQIIQWIHHFGVDTFEEMTNLSKVLRQKLEETCEIKAPEALSEHLAADGTRKWVLQLESGNAIETVLIPEPKRRTLCISSQVGCLLDCSFCCTGKQGFSRNLTRHEIIGQLWAVNRSLRAAGLELISNVVMMGMGEPLLNYDEVLPALKLMRSDFGYGLSKRRVTVSTSGIVPKIFELARDCDVALAISLHAPTDELRNELVPINKKHNIKSLMNACSEYLRQTTHKTITMEYVMLKGVNDTPAHARALIQVLKAVPSKVNLIPFNPFPKIEYERSTPEVISAFRDILMKADIMTMVRRTRGDDIAAACGQLAGQVNDRTYRALRFYGSPDTAVGED